MYTGAVPTTSIYSTWVENVEIWSVDDDELMDLSTVTEITLKVKDQRTKFDELLLTYTGGDITIPSDGIIQWRVEASRMGAIEPKTYELILLLEDDTDVVDLMLGSVSIVD